MGYPCVYGFKKGNVEKVAYSHYGGDLNGVGQEIVEFVQNTSINELNKIFEKIILVNEKDNPSKELFKRYEKYFNSLEFPEHSLEKIEWRELLHETQGELTPYKDNLEHMVDGSNDSYYFKYLIDLDENEFIVENEDGQNSSFPLNAIPIEWDTMFDK